MYRLGLVLRQPELAGVPVVPATGHMQHVAAASVFPDRPPRMTTAPAPVAIFLYRAREGRTGDGAAGQYVAAGSPWETVVECRFGTPATMEVLALPGATVPDGGGRQLAARLREQVPGTECTAPASP